MPSEHEDIIAKSRADVYSPKCVTPKSPGAAAYVQSRAEMELLLDLQIAGMPSTMAVLFLQILWRSGVGTDHKVSIEGVAKDTGKLRPCVSRSINGLQNMGAMMPVLPISRPGSWAFPVYAELLRRVRTKYGKDPDGE